METADAGAPTIDVHLTGDDLRAALVEDVRVGLTATEKWLPPVWFYDERGSELFDEITRLPEYYLTRAERRLLEANAAEIAARAKADTLVELGAGTCEKSRVLLDAMRAAGTLERYIPLDVSDTTLWSAANDLAAEYPGLSVQAVVGDFHRHMDQVPMQGRRMVAFLGSTIGNLTLAQRTRFLFDLDCVMVHGDSLLLGTDLVKDLAILQAAYDDSAGVTAAFNRNVLYVLNRELKADFDPERFAHVARVERRGLVHGDAAAERRGPDSVDCRARHGGEFLGRGRPPHRDQLQVHVVRSRGRALERRLRGRRHVGGT